MKIDLFCTLCIDLRKTSYEITFSFTNWSWFIRKGEAVGIYAFGPISIIAFDNEMIVEKTKQMINNKE